MKLTLAVAIAVLAANAAQASNLKAWQIDALDEVKAENTVLDARWRMPETNVLWVAMTPDGSRRDGFAQYLCMALGGAPEGDLKTIFIYDPATYKDGIGEAMGMAACR